MQQMILVYNREEQPYLSRLNQFLSTSKVITFCGAVDTMAQLGASCKSRGISKIITTREDILKRLLPSDRSKGAKISNYAGSILPYEYDGFDIEILILNPLKQLITVSYGEFLAGRFLSKFTNPEQWRQTSEFKWSWLKNESDFQAAYDKLLTQSVLVSCDIETVQPERFGSIGIDSISYCAKFQDGSTHSYVFDIHSMDAVHWMRKFNAIPQPKVFQNGKYDNAYLCAYSAPITNWIGDTKNAMHASYAELPKDLAFLSALLIRNSMYWKDLSASPDRIEQLKYNALDTWATLEAFISWALEAPKWAWNNYITKFPQMAIAHRCEMLGIKRDLPRLEKEAAKFEYKMEKNLKSLQIMVDEPKFNPSSPKQVLQLLHILGCKDAEGTDEPTLQKYIDSHPLNERILGTILEYRGDRKLASTYLTTGDKAKEYKGRILYSSNPDGTDTGRSSSREHAFWCGLQMQNIPTENKGEEVKDTLVADDDFDIYEADYSQAEARGVAYCSGDPRLLEAVECGRDFHSSNASAFFGVPYEEIYRDAVEIPQEDGTVLIIEAKTLDKALRDLAKRVNHGANYNMGPWMLLITMGEKNVRKAQRLLNLPKQWSLQQVCEYLLSRYEATYPRVKGGYYQSIRNEVAKTSKMVGPTGWTRWCFGDPNKNKMDLNSLVAHKTQSLNAMILDEAMLRVFNWQRRTNNWSNIKILMQIHDSILFQCRKGHEHLAKELKTLMTFAVPITDYLGVTRDMTVPVDLKSQGHRWSGNPM